MLREISVAGKCVDKIMVNNIDYTHRFNFKNFRKYVLHPKNT